MTTTQLDALCAAATTQDLDVNVRLDNLIGLRNALKGGAA
jgi:hypothetical protein